MILGDHSPVGGGGVGGVREGFILLALLLGIHCPVLKTLKAEHTMQYYVHHSSFFTLAKSSHGKNL